MTTKMKGNMLIAQSGGPSMVINRSLVGAILEAKSQKVSIEKIYGALHGVQGIMQGKLVDLGRETASTLKAVAASPCSALGSVRKKPKPEECVTILQIMKNHNIRFFFYIGGNDSAETASIIDEESRKSGYELCCYHIPKTIDNDLRENDHTPGYGSAAKFVACAMLGLNADNSSLPGVHISVIMGRHAGFLTAASALARQSEDDGPHLLYFPERPFDMDAFIADVENVYKRFGRCMVAVSEGIVDNDGTPIATKFTKEVDAHGNVQLSGTGALGDLLAAQIREKTGISRVRADTFGYLQRSFPGIVSEVDAVEAEKVARVAVKTAVKKYGSASIAIKREGGKKYRVVYESVPLSAVAKETRHMPDEFIAQSANNITPAFLDYVKPLVGKLPVMGRLKAIRV